MRLLHTADWHLGRAFHGESLLDAQAAFVDFLVDVARSAAVDGDPGRRRPVRPRAAAGRRGATRRRGAGAAVRGRARRRHLRQPRLGRAARLRRGAARARGRARAHRSGRDRRAGALGDALVYAIPYLEPDLVREPLGVEERGARARRWAPRWRGSGRTSRTRPGAARRSSSMAHAFVAGAMPSESERDLAVGGAANVPARRSRAPTTSRSATCTGRRVGGGAAATPAPRSRSRSPRRASAKSVAVVELGRGALPLVELLPFPVPRPLATLRGTLDELLADPAHCRPRGARGCRRR